MENSVKKINILDAVQLFFKNYFNFYGRSSRGEYWWFVLAYVIVSIIALCIDATMAWYYNSLSMFDGINYSNPYDVYYSPMVGAASIIGITSLTSRRLQDMGRSGWWQAPLYLAQIPLFIFLALMFASGFNIGVIALAVIFSLAYLGYVILIIVWLCLPPKEDQNNWGRNPLLLNQPVSNS
tara:strand:+ start:451 stop:993 length:543 start_codon:yes stop_codon:yes gene_type:complete